MHMIKVEFGSSLMTVACVEFTFKSTFRTFCRSNLNSRKLSEMVAAACVGFLHFAAPNLNPRIFPPTLECTFSIEIERMFGANLHKHTYLAAS